MLFFRRQDDVLFSQNLMDRLFYCDCPEGFELAEIVDVQDIDYDNSREKFSKFKDSRSGLARLRHLKKAPTPYIITNKLKTRSFHE
jgi:hypothetical protein